MNKKTKIPIMAFGLIIIVWLTLAKDCETCEAVTGEADYYDEGLQMYSKVFFKGTNVSRYGILVISCDFPNNSNSYNVEVAVHASTYINDEPDLTPFKLKVWDIQGSGVNPGKPAYINPNNELGIGQLTRSFSLMIHTDYNEGTCIFRTEVWDEDEINKFADLTLIWHYGESEKKPADPDLAGEDGDSSASDFFPGLTGGQIVLIGLTTVLLTTWATFWFNNKASYKS